MSKWKIAGINFDHLHMGDNLRMAFEHADVEIVGICDEQPSAWGRRARILPFRPTGFSATTGNVWKRPSPTSSCCARPLLNTGSGPKRSRLWRAHHHGKTLRRHPRPRRTGCSGPWRGRANCWRSTGRWLVSTAPHGAAAHCRRRDRRGDRGSLLRRQPRALWHLADKVEAHRCRRRAGKTHELVLQKGGGRGLSAGLSRVRHHIGHLVHGAGHLSK